MSAAPEKRSYVARLFGSLANTLLDLGLPRIRAWLRARVGPEADVGHVTADGPLIHLDGVHVPLGPRGRLVLDRATAAIAPNIGARLHEFRGELVFGARGAPEFRAEISFEAFPDPDDGAWISGELRVARATWTSGEGAPAAEPMTGVARLFVTSSAWRVEGGQLRSEHASVRFEGRGSLERETEVDDALLVPSALGVVKLILEPARVGPFVDAMVAIGGRTLRVPPFVPRDARLFGELAWCRDDGVRADLRVDSEAITATLRGTVSARGADLGARLEADLRPTVTLRALGLDPIALPRDEDVARIEIEATGEARRPTLRGSVRSVEIGFRLGRPRFVPVGLVLRDVAIAITSENDRHLRAALTARVARGKMHATLDGELVSSFDGVSLDGKVTLATPRSSLAIAPLVRGRELAGTRLEGRVALEELVDAGLFVRPEFRAHGEVDVDLSVAGTAADGEGETTSAGRGARALRGTIASQRVSLEVPDIGLVEIRDVRGEIVGTPEMIRWRELRFSAFQGGFRSDGVARRGGPAADATSGPSLRPRRSAASYALHEVSVRFVDAGPALLELASRAAESRVRVCAARTGIRPGDEAWIDPATTLSGEARLLADRSFAADVSLKTPAGSAVVARLVVAGDRLDGSTVHGDVALADMLLAGAGGGAVHALPEGTATIDGALRGGVLEPVMTGWIAAETLRLGVREAKMAALLFHDVRGLFRVDARRTVWRRFEAQAYDGALASTGFVEDDTGRVAATLTLSAVHVARVPIPEGTAGAFVRGLLSGWIRFDRRDARSATVASGHAELAHGEFPVLGTSRAILSRYGLSALPERATQPATVKLALSEGCWSLSELRASVHGASIAGDLRVADGAAIDGSFVVTLDEDYLRSSAILVLPAIFAERLTVPMRVAGTLASPKIDADLTGALNRFASDNHLSAFASELFGIAARPAPAPAPASPPVAPPDELITSDTDWHPIELRLNEYRRQRARYRVG